MHLALSCCTFAVQNSLRAPLSHYLSHRACSSCKAVHSGKKKKTDVVISFQQELLTYAQLVDTMSALSAGEPEECSVSLQTDKTRHNNLGRRKLSLC